MPRSSVGEPEICARCGHRSQGCANCDRRDPFLGSHIGITGQPYCHTFSPERPTCYELTQRERAAALANLPPKGPR